MNDNRFIFDPGQRRLTYRSMLVSQSTTPNLPATAIGVEMSSNSPIPKLRAEIRIPKLEGSIGAFRYIALDNKLVVEITPKPQPPGPVGSPRVVSNPEKVHTTESPWAAILGAGVVVAAGVIVFGAIVDEWIPIIGQADDVPAYLAASAMVARGLAMMGGTSGNLPSTAMPAVLDAKASVRGPSM